MPSKKLCFLFFTMNLFLFASAQSKVRFNIIDAETAKPLESVSVFIYKLKLVNVTSDSGYTSFNNIPAGVYDIEFSETGYKKEELELKLSSSGTDTTIIVSLKPDETRLQQVTVVSTRSNNGITDEPQRVEVLGQEEIKEELNIHPGNISKLLGENPGIQTQQTSAVSGNMNFRILGLNGNYTQLLKDGFPLYGALSSDLSLLSIPPLDLQQVEIIKGASSDLYGGNAIAGVINLISRAPQMGKPFFTMMLNQTPKGGRDINAFYSRRNNYFGLTFMASATSQKPKDIDNDVFTDLPYLRQVSFSPKFLYYFNDSVKLIIGLNASFEERKGGDLFVVNNQPDSFHSYIEINKTNRKYSTLLYEKHLHNGGLFTLKNSVGYFTRNFSTSDFNFHGIEWNTYSEASFLKTWEQHKIVGALNFNTDKFTEKADVRSDSLGYNYSTISGFIQDTWILNPSWMLQAGVRVDKHNRYDIYLLPHI